MKEITCVRCGKAFPSLRKVKYCDDCKDLVRNENARKYYHMAKNNELPVGKKWTKEDYDFLKENYSKIDVNDIAKHLGRSNKAIYATASQLHLQKEMKTKESNWYIRRGQTTHTLICGIIRDNPNCTIEKIAKKFSYIKMCRYSEALEKLTELNDAGKLGIYTSKDGLHFDYKKVVLKNEEVGTNNRKHTA